MTQGLPRFHAVPDEDALQRLIDDPNWLGQQKVDGIRCLATVHPDGRVALTSGNGGPLKNSAAGRRFDQIRDGLSDLAGIFPDPVALDGEIIHDADIPLHAFDVEADGPFADRHRFLEALVGHDRWPAGAVQVVPVAAGKRAKQELREAVLARGGEGIMLKHRNMPYKRGERRRDGLKAKVTHTADLVVLERGPGNGREGTGNWMRLGIVDDGQLVEVGRCSTIGKPHAERGDVVEVKYLYVGAGGRLVQPSMIRVRDDKAVVDCDGADLVGVNKEIVA